MGIQVTFACGHTGDFTGAEASLHCKECAETAVARVDAPPPQFEGHVRGPHAEFRELPAKPVTFGETP